MKKLPVEKQENKDHLNDYSQHLVRVGYNQTAQKNMISALREFLYRLEHQQVQLKEITPKDI